MLATLITNTKDGTGLNVLVPIEYALVPLALAGAVVVGTRWLGIAVLAFVLAQSASLLVSPVTNTPFLYPTSERGAWGRAGSEAEVRREVAKAEACPPGVAFSGPPFLAFLGRAADARRSSPTSSCPRAPRHLKDVQARMDAVQPRCA